jgi:hypothetical protein
MILLLELIPWMETERAPLTKSVMVDINAKYDGRLPPGRPPRLSVDDFTGRFG